MKFKKLLTIALIATPLLTACGNKDVLGTTYTFKHAIIKLPDNAIIKGDVKKWARQSETDTVRVTLEDNKGTYLVHTSDCVLYND